jgi:diguanylate cyclase (GGDEF)-like protein
MSVRSNGDSGRILDDPSWVTVERAAAARDRAAAARDRAAAARDRTEAAEDRRRAAEFLHASYRDELSGALTRRAGLDQLRAEVRRALRRKEALPLVFVDVDHLKWTNDTLGHHTGDLLISATGAALRQSLRSYDVIVRYGGDEFVCALPGSALETAVAALARARQLLDAMVPGATFSAGRALLRADDTLEDVVRRADSDLYRRRSQTRRDHTPQHTRTGNVAGLLPTLACAACGADIPVTAFSRRDATSGPSAVCGRCTQVTVVRLETPATG